MPDTDIPATAIRIPAAYRRGRLADVIAIDVDHNGDRVEIRETKPMRTLTLRTHDGAYTRNRIPAATHILANELPGVVVGTACGRVFGFFNTSGMTIDAEPRPVTCQACRNA